MRQIVEDVTMPAPTGRMPGEPDPGADPLDEEAVTPEEQQFYDTFMNKALEFIHGPKSSRAVLKHLNQRDLSIPEAVGRTTAMIAQQIISSAQAAGQEVNSDAVFAAGQEVVEELLELGSRAKIFPMDWPQDGKQQQTPEQEQVAQQAFSLAAHYFTEGFIKTDQGKSLQNQAQGEVLRNIRAESQAGTLDADFLSDPNTVEGGVKRALIRAQAG